MSPVCELSASNSCAAVHAKKIGPMVELFEKAVIELDVLHYAHQDWVQVYSHPTTLNGILTDL